MTLFPLPSPSKKDFLKYAVFTGALLIAIISARPYAGSWNDGSRLASVESLVDYHTWSIDESVFVRTPGIITRNGDLAYPASDPTLVREGTMDKLYIKELYYSDKSPLPSLIMAGVYKALKTVTGLSASGNPALFCYVMALIFSGGAYVISVCCMDAMAAMLGLTTKLRLLFVCSFALATIALPYAREVNNHIMLLGVFSAIMFLAVAYVQPDGNAQWRLLMIGSLMGIGYTIDLGAGPILVLCVTGLIAVQTRSWNAVALVLIMAFPWFAMHHLLNYEIGGTFKPANAVADYFLWPGSPFTPKNLTGGWAHPNARHFLIYALDMLFGKQGFIGHNLPLYLCLPAIAILLRSKAGHRPLFWFSLCLILGTWLIYAITSNNYSGACCSIRWFVPLLAPFFYLLAVILKERPESAIDLLILTAWGFVLGAVMWFEGPWIQHMEPGFWWFQAGALFSWLGWRLKIRTRREATHGAPGEPGRKS